jgi:uncharacterized protein (DUF362 family)
MHGKQAGFKNSELKKLESRLPGNNAIIAIADGDHVEPCLLLDQALESAGFWQLPAHDKYAASAGRVLILVDLYAFELAQPVFTRIELVEHLIDALARYGWSDIAIGSSPDSSITWAENRDVAVVADLLGYRYETPSGTHYDVLDMSENLMDAGFPLSSALAGSSLSRNWIDADLRIVFPKCKTDLREVFALCSNSLLYVLPLADKDYYYRQRVDTVEALAALLGQYPPHFAIVDACGAAHGSGAQQSPVEVATNAVIAGIDPLAVDCAVATKMGADPAASPLVAGLIAALGRPPVSNVIGNRSVFRDFLLPDPILVESTRARERSAVFARLVAPWLQRVDENLFPFKNLLDSKINSAVAHRFAELDEDLAAKFSLIYWNYVFSGLDKYQHAWRISGGDKDTIMRRVTGVSPETLACGEEEYYAMHHELEDMEAWLDAHCHEKTPLRWRYLDRAVVFDYSHTYPVPFEEFVQRVDISRTIQFMNDYIGGALLPIEWDSSGRPVRQVERNLYLPQPNYLAWWDGKEIDVSKIESVIYTPDRQRMFWKTIKSENQSAIFDDGIVTFEAAGEFTRVIIFGRQLFVLPPLLELAQLERYPQLKSALVEDAYKTFFRRTFANFEALLEKRDIAIGRPWHIPKTAHDSAKRPIESLVETATRFSELAAPWIDSFLNPQKSSITADGGRKMHGETDALGFTHFRVTSLNSTNSTPDLNSVSSWLIDFYKGYIGALGRDGTAMKWPDWRAATDANNQPAS